ncbi:MAG: alginate lyase family protein [Lentisphaeria bacterium]|nr:alginate lyase family protein [Lentisphaeria bacterium]
MKMWIGIVFLLTGAVLTAVDWPFCPGVPEVLRIQAERNQSIRPILQNRLQASRLALSSILQEPHWNVVEGKPLQPASKNPHDYMSMGTYWWPDPAKPDGLPYIHKDGYPNPASAKLDNFKLNKMRLKLSRLAGLAYFDGNKAAGECAAEQLRVFFLDPATRMNPHLKYSQAIPGICDGRTSGLIDGYALAEIADYIGMLHLAGFLSKKDMLGLRKWYGDFGLWLRTDPISETDRNSCHNHGLAYQLMVIVCAEMAGDMETAKLHARRIPRLIRRGIREDGAMIMEMVRPTAWDYHLFAMRMVLELGSTLRPLDVDLLAPESDSGKRIRAALEFLAKTAQDTKSWPFQQVQKFRVDYLGGLLMRMFTLTGEEKWKVYYDQLDSPRGHMVAEYFFSPDNWRCFNTVKK